MKGRCPIPSDYATEEEYRDALDAYETAEYWYIEEYHERHHGE